MFARTPDLAEDARTDSFRWTSPTLPGRLERHGDDVQREVTAGHADIQRLIGDLAIRLLTIEPDAIHENIADGLRQIARILRLDRATFWGKAAGGAAPSELSDLTSRHFVTSKLASGGIVSIARLNELPEEGDRQALLRLGLRSVIVAPVTSAATEEQGALILGSMNEREWPAAVIEQLRVASAVVGQALTRKASAEALQQAQDDLQSLRQSLDDPARPVSHEPRVREQRQTDNACVRSERHDSHNAAPIIGQSTAIRRVLEQLQKVAATDSTVLLLGETGTGKELLATHLHEESARRGRSMVRVNCAAIPATLMESELFGRERGAFTGALARQIGRFELAHRSTIFLDEIGDLPSDIQVKLLRVLEERQIERLGSPKAIDVDVRIVAATHRNLEQRIGEDSFREDLFYRLNVFPIQVPALRDRIEDIPLLVWRFVDEFSKAFGKQIDSIPRENMIALQRYSWPGNIRELRNVVERAMIVVTGNQLTIALPVQSGSSKRSSATLVEVEKDHIRGVLETTMWRIRGVGGAAERLGLRPTTLESRMAKLGLSRPKPV